jgi:hypothetical protein
MDNFQEVNSSSNVPSSRTFKIYNKLNWTIYTISRKFEVTICSVTQSNFVLPWKCKWKECICLRSNGKSVIQSLYGGKKELHSVTGIGVNEATCRSQGDFWPVYFFRSDCYTSVYITVSIKAMTLLGVFRVFWTLIALYTRMCTNFRNYFYLKLLNATWHAW